MSSSLESISRSMFYSMVVHPGFKVGFVGTIMDFKELVEGLKSLCSQTDEQPDEYNPVLSKRSRDSLEFSNGSHLQHYDGGLNSLMGQNPDLIIKDDNYVLDEVWGSLSPVLVF